jgi:hypothetical protein
MPPSISDAFNVIKNVFDGVGKVFKGIGEEFDAVGESVEIGVTDIFTLIEFVFIFLGSYIGCGVYFLMNIRNCFFYYLLEILGQILYIPVRICVWIFSLFSFNLQKYLDIFWSKMEILDRIVYKYGGFHIIHYPRSVRQKCYVCKRLKTQVLVDKSNIIKDDFAPRGRIEQVFNKGINTIREGGNQIMNPL